MIDLLFLLSALAALAACGALLLLAWFILCAIARGLVDITKQAWRG